MNNSGFAIYAVYAWNLDDNNSLTVNQVSTMKGYLECQVLRWRSTTWEMHLKEVGVHVLVWLLNIYIYIEYTPTPPPQAVEL